MINKKFALILMAGLSAGLFAQSNKKVYTLDFNPKKYEIKELKLNDKTFKVRAYENIIYVKNPVDINYQKMNIYIPIEYFNGKSINGYTAETAPIFYPNEVGGYMPGPPASTTIRPMGPPPMDGKKIDGGQRPNGDFPNFENIPDDLKKRINNNFPKRPNTVVEALARGYVVASAGARGRTSMTGKAPSAIVDLKAGVRYLKYNDKIMPGDANKIISNGTSAGGAMSALLGATGDNPDYLPYLNELGAANASDAIFASSDYCPITNLEHADMAYEWQFNGVNTYQKSGPFGPIPNAPILQLSDAQIKVSNELKPQFPSYLNSLNLKDKNGVELTLDAAGNGNFKDLVKSYVIASANKAIGEGTDLSKHTWLTIQNAKVTDLDWDAYVRYMQRQKTPPAFDALDLSTPENQEFGTEKVDKQHFAVYSQQNSTVAGSTIADEHIIKMMNPINYIGTSNTQTAKHWRIRHGSNDKDTGLAISVILATYLQNKGYEVDLALPWAKPHSGDYDLNELFQWIDSFSK